MLQRSLVFVALCKFLRYERLERINSLLDAPKEYMLMKRITSAIIEYLGAKRTAQRARDLLKNLIFNFKLVADRRPISSHLHIQIFLLPGPRLKEHQPGL
jgi:hypothetical protein